MTDGSASDTAGTAATRSHAQPLDEQAARQRVLVSAEWLEAHLASPGVCVVDVRGAVLPPGSSPRYKPKREEYDAGHVPGAVFVDWTRDIVDLQDPVPVQVAPGGAFAATMSALGIGDDTLVVAYDDYHHIFAGRLAWALRYYGHDQVRILDGGWSRWVEERRPISRDRPARPAARFTARVIPAFRRNADEVDERLGRSEVLLLDARPPEQYDGRVSAAKRSGHIPGARNVHYARLVDANTGRFLPAAELARVFAESGVDVATLPPEVIVYCNGGVSCTVPLNALRLLGRDDVAVYDGSWNEWGNDAARPVASGPEP
ncbi:MAG TPA: sulfurtransferase [Polyangiaceae bacterium]|nr:sulfurtransferase [Polyangiaceae bacterium]